MILTDVFFLRCNYHFIHVELWKLSSSSIPQLWIFTIRYRRWDTPLLEQSSADLPLISQYKPDPGRTGNPGQCRREFLCPRPGCTGRTPSRSRSSPLRCNNRSPRASSEWFPTCGNSSRCSRIRGALQDHRERFFFARNVWFRIKKLVGKESIFTVLTNLCVVFVPRDFRGRMPCHLTRESHRVRHLHPSIPNSHCELGWSVLRFVP